MEWSKRERASLTQKYTTPDYIICRAGMQAAGGAGGEEKAKKLEAWVAQRLPAFHGTL
jgi:hypothetical protein